MLFTPQTIDWMSALMFDDCNTESIRARLSKVDHVRKPPHERAPNVQRENQPTARCGSDSKNLTLKFIDELLTQTRCPILVKLTSLFKLSLDCWMVLDDHRRSLAISSS
jgi:hypothetical protein